MNEPGATADAPLFIKWVTDNDGKPRWGRILLMLSVTMASAYLSVRAQRAASSPDLGKSLAMGMARQRITTGVRLQRLGRAVEEAGWAAYESARN